MYERCEQCGCCTDTEDRDCACGDVLVACAECGSDVIAAWESEHADHHECRGGGDHLLGARPNDCGECAGEYA